MDAVMAFLMESPRVIGSGSRGIDHQHLTYLRTSLSNRICHYCRCSSNICALIESVQLLVRGRVIL